jgi:hypothetical protein
MQGQNSVQVGEKWFCKYQQPLASGRVVAARSVRELSLVREQERYLTAVFQYCGMEATRDYIHDEITAD